METMWSSAIKDRISTLRLALDPEWAQLAEVLTPVT
jgi:hypothetical protein